MNLGLKGRAFCLALSALALLVFQFLGLRPRSRSDFGAGFGPKGFGNLAQALAWAKIGVGTKVSFAPPSEPDWQISRIRLSSW
jgi:hypothetical protein